MLKSREELILYLSEFKEKSIILINIDNFNNYNLQYGFHIADEILKEVGNLLNMIKPLSSILFRVGIDEFAIVHSNKTIYNDELAKSILSFFNHTEIEIDDINIKASISIGIDTGFDDSILKNAQIAISLVRQYSRNNYLIYKHDFLNQDKIDWINKIKKFLEEDNLIVYYQPIVDNKTGKIKYECLSRFSENGLIIPPYKFLEASKITGTLSLITKNVIEKSFKFFSGTEIEFSINITAEDFEKGELKTILINNLRKNNIKATQVIIEILEDISSLKGMCNQLKELRDLGFQIAIDDFGSSSSNLSRIIEFNPDYIKIDGSFIRDLLINKNSLIIVEAIVYICKKADIKTVAEFVHSKEILDKVIELGIDYSQGFYFGEPKGLICVD